MPSSIPVSVFLCASHDSLQLFFQPHEGRFVLWFGSQHLLHICFTSHGPSTKLPLLWGWCAASPSHAAHFLPVFRLRVVFHSSPLAPQDLIDRLIAVNSDVKIHSLFHYEQSHTFGLRWDWFFLHFSILLHISSKVVINRLAPVDCTHAPLQLWLYPAHMLLYAVIMQHWKGDERISLDQNESWVRLSGSKNQMKSSLASISDFNY